MSVAMTLIGILAGWLVVDLFELWGWWSREIPSWVLMLQLAFAACALIYFVSEWRNTTIKENTSPED